MTTNTGLYTRVGHKPRLAVYEGRDWLMKQGWDDYHKGTNRVEWSTRQRAWYNIGWNAAWSAINGGVVGKEWVDRVPLYLPNQNMD